jgi:molybdate transport system ATP-binding protein
MLDLVVGKRIGRIEIDAAFRVNAGETLAIAGESGAGKTTLLRLIAGLDHPDRGLIAVDGTRWFDSEHRIRWAPHRRDIGFVPQDYALFPHLSVEDNVAFGPRSVGRPHDAVRAATAALMERFGISELAHRKPDQLSGGQQQRVALARALALEPRVLLLDEPLAALDLHSRRQVRADLRERIHRFGCVTLFVTHSPAEAFYFGDRIAVLGDGRVLRIGTPQELKAQPGSDEVAAILDLAPA